MQENMLENVRKAMEGLEAEGKKPSMRAVRERVGVGSFTDIGEAMRRIKEDRDRLNTVRTELPQVLQDKAGLLTLDLWTAAQEMANRAIEDVRRGCEMRVTTAENQASESLREIDEADARIRDLTQRLAGLEKSERSASERAEAAEARVGALEAEIRVMHDHAKHRERELELAHRSVDRMVGALGAKHKAKSAGKAATDAKDSAPTG